MSYISQTELENRYASVRFWADRDQDGTADTSVIARAIADAEAEVNLAVGQQYALPLTLSDANTQAMIKNACLVLAGFKLASGSNDAASAASIETEYRAVQDWLKRVAAGAVKLLGESVTGATSPSGAPIVVGDTGLLTRDSMDGF